MTKFILKPEQIVFFEGRLAKIIKTMGPWTKEALEDPPAAFIEMLDNGDELMASKEELIPATDKALELLYEGDPIPKRPHHQT